MKKARVRAFSARAAIRGCPFFYIRGDGFVRAMKKNTASP